MPFSHRPISFHRIFVIGATIALLSAHVFAALNSQEQAVANSLTQASGQRRPFMVLDPILSQVARERATDMAKRRYFGHTNPDGHGANYLVRRAGYTLPSNYPADGNNLESIAAGQTSPSAAWSSWMGSPPHKQHLLGELSFYATQTSYGIGYYNDPGSPNVYYWVVITAPPNLTPPVSTPAPLMAAISIATPAADARVVTPEIAIAGTTSGTKPASVVRFRVENVAGVGPFKTATGTAAWSGSIAGLVPGANTIRVQSLDAGGAVLKEATRAVHYVVTRELTVSVRGEGALTTGFAGTTDRELARSYTIAATPAAGWLFDGWSGGANSRSATLTFTMAANLTLTATFIPNPYTAHKGSYNGLVRGDAGSGFLKVAMSSAGRFTGSLTFGGAAYSLAGAFDHAGNASVTIRRAGLASLILTLHADLAGGTQRITGSLTDGTRTASISADRARQSEEGASPFAGRYTVSLPGVSNTNPALPHGHGYAVLSVDSAGVATLTGVLADARTFSRSATISKEGDLPIYAPLYGSGSLAGVLHFRETSVSDLDGTLHWSKPARPLDRYHKAAFEIDNPVIGSRYEKPAAATRVIAVPDARDNVRLEFGDGDLAASVDQPATLDASNRVLLSTPEIAGLRVTINTANGRYTGSFTHPATGGTRAFNGVIFQKQNAGYGYFLGVAESGFSAFGVAR